MTEAEERERTGYSLGVSPTLPSSYEDNVLLARVHVVVLQDEKFVDAIFLQCVDFDNGADRADQAFIKHNVFLSTDLLQSVTGRSGQAAHSEVREATLLTPSRR